MTTPARNRAADCERIERAAHTTIGGARRTMVIVGEPGIGKSALIEEASRLMRQHGFAMGRAKAESIERHRAFGLVRRALVGAADTAGADLTIFDVLGHVEDRHMPEFRGLVDAPELRFRVIDQITEAVGRLLADRPIALVLDDLQWADRGSLDVLMALHERLHDRALLIVAATRPSPVDARLERFLAGVRPDDTIRLGPLDDVNVVELLTEQIGSPPTPEQISRYSRAGGNPLFIKTLVASSVADSTGSDDESADLPESVRRLVATQLLDFGRETRTLLDIAATIGGRFSLSTLAPIAGRPLQEVIALVQPAIRSGLLVDNEEGLSFRHDLVRDVIFDSIAPSVRASLHLEIGRHLMARSTSEAALHFLRGAQIGDVDASGVLRQAAAEVGRVAPSEASRLLERALAVLPADHPDCDATVVELAQSYVFSDRLDASTRLIDERLGHGLDPGIEFDLRNARTQVFFLRGQPRRAAEEFDAIAQLVDDDPREPVIFADAAVSSMFAVDLRRARELAERSLTESERHGDLSAPPLALGVLAWLTALDGDVDGGVRIAAEAVSRADMADGLEGHRRIPHLFHAQCLMWADRLDEARASLRRGRRVSGELGMGWDEPMYHALAADERIRCGEWDDALAEIEAGLRRSAEVGATFADSWLHVHHAKILIARGLEADATTALDRAMTGIAGNGGQGVDQVWMLRGLTTAKTDAAAATSMMLMLWHKLDELGVTLRQFEYAPDVVAVALAADRRDVAGLVTDRVQFLADAQTSAIGEVTSTWCRGLTEQNPEILGRAGKLADESGNPLAAARARADAARAMGRRTGSNDAEKMVEASRAEFERLAAPGWDRWYFGPVIDRPTQDRPTSGWDSLTRSERRVIELVGEGRTNVEIAETLNLSRRTVESHLYHSYPKLGLSSRVELVLLVNRRPND